MGYVSAWMDDLEDCECGVWEGRYASCMLELDFLYWFVIWIGR